MLRELVLTRAAQQDRIPWLHRIRETAILLTSPAGLTALDRPSHPPSPREVHSEPLSHELAGALQHVHPDALAARLERTDEQGITRERAACVVACSALTKEYRKLLRGEEARFHLLDGREVVSDSHLEPHIETFFVYCASLLPLSLSCTGFFCSRTFSLTPFEPRPQCTARARCCSSAWRRARAIS